MKYLSLTTFVLYLFTVCSASAQTPQVNWLPAERSQTRLLAEKILTRESLPTTSTTFQLHVRVSLEGDTVTRRVRQVVFFPSYNEAQNEGNEKLYWDPLTEKLTLLEAGVVNSNGSYLRLDQKNIRILDSNSYNTFTDDKEVILPFSGLKDGSLAVLEYEISYRRQDLESRWMESNYPVLFDPVEDYRFQFVNPEEQDFSASLQHPQLECVQSLKGVSCKGQNLKPYKEDKGVVWRDVLGRISVGEKLSWNDVINFNLRAIDKADYESTEVNELFNSLVEEELTLGEKIERLFRFVSRDIRYISMSELGHRITPHKSAAVIKNRFGDCKDKSALLLGLLKIADVNAFPVLIATERRDPELLKIPSGNYFDHMVVCFKVDDISYCLDPTDTSTHWKTKSDWIQGKVSLPLIENIRPVTIPKPKHRWRAAYQTTLKFDAEAAQHEKTHRVFYGEYASLMRSSLAPSTEEERTETLLSQYHNTVNNSVTPEFSVSGVDDMAHKLEVHSETNYSPFLQDDAALNYTEPNYWLRKEMGDAKLSTEHYDTWTDGFNIFSRVKVDFEDLWKVQRLPPTLDLQSRFGSMRREVKQEGRYVTAETRVELPAQKIRQQDIESWNKLLDLFRREANMSFEGELN